MYQLKISLPHTSFIATQLPSYDLENILDNELTNRTWADSFMGKLGTN